MRVLAVIGGVGGLGGLGGCVGNRGAARAPVSTTPAATMTEQVLLRLRVEGEPKEGALRLRVVLRRAAGSFELRASDVLGRSQWTLRVASGRVLWLDLRARRACNLAFDRGARALGWPDLPWEVVPAILLGESPVPESGLDAAGREWVLERGPGGRLEGWSVSANGTELARFSAKAAEIRLESDRPRVVLTWSIAAREFSDGPVEDATSIPEGFRLGGCDGLRVP